MDVILRVVLANDAGCSGARIGFFGVAPQQRRDQQRDTHRFKQVLPSVVQHSHVASGPWY